MTLSLRFGLSVTAFEIKEEWIFSDLGIARRSSFDERLES
jgi:hypothetical protein